MKVITSLFLLLVILGAGIALRAQSTSAPAQGAAPAPPATVSSSSSVDIQGIRNYLLGPGDTVSVRVFGQPDFNWDGEVDSDGNLRIFFIDTPIAARCKSEQELQKTISTAYSRYLRNPQVSVRITGHNSRPPAIVHGAVYAPQRFQMMRSVHLNELLAFAGGVTERSNGTIEVLHTEEVMCPEPGEVVEAAQLHYYKVADLLAGRSEANPVIRPGDIVRAIEAEPVYITGNVVSPQGLYLREQWTLTRALGMVGGAAPNSDLSRVTIIRQKPGDAEPQVIKVNYNAIKKGQQPDVHLQPYDVVNVPRENEFTPSTIWKTLIRGIVPGAMQSIGATVPLRVIY
ncbi:MAG TPA: polysaccharide biosynthesis/export family protein [Pyrinomonadaceae bacterium]|nr:polysaccharide biosynthesis/export family protein [Pyrinomonadaceae bacterium]